MNEMFSCLLLASLDLSNFESKMVNNMTEMFYETSSLIYLNSKNFDTSKCNHFSNFLEKNYKTKFLIIYILRNYK